MARFLCAWVLLAAVSARPLEIRAVDGAVLRPLTPDGAAGVLLFVSTDCPVSNRYAPEIQRLCTAAAVRGVPCTLLYEDADVRPDAVRTHLREYGYALPAAIDTDGAVAAAVKATITPEAVVVDRGGGVRYRGRIDNLFAALGTSRQVVTSHDLRDAIDAVVANRPVARPQTDAIGCFIVPANQRRHRP
jgi:hypothetical protein